MASGIEAQVDIIVKTLLHTGIRVIEMSREFVMCRIWDVDDCILADTYSNYLGRKVSEIHTDETLGLLYDKARECFATRADSYWEYNMLVNGRSVPMSVRMLHCHPTTGFIFIVIEDISGRRQPGPVENIWKLALDAAGDGIWDVNMETGAIFFSEKWHEITGYTSDEVKTGADWRDKIFPDDIETANSALQDYEQGRKPIYSAEVRYRCKDGSYKWLLSRGVAVSRRPDGTALRFVGTHRDITERKIAEEELRVSREIFAGSFSHSGIGKALLAPGGMWIEVNDVICALTEYSREELLTLHYRDITYPDDVDIDMPLIMQLAKGEIKAYTIEKRYVSKSRKIITVLLTVTVVRKPDGSPRYFICDIIDISGQKMLAGELERKNRALEAASANLVSKIDQLEELNAIAAHNLRGPAANIKVISEDRTLFPPDEALTMIAEASNNLLNELNVLLELSRIRINKNVQFDICDIRKTSMSVVSQLAGDIYQKHIKVNYDFKVHNVKFPKLYLESVLYNLVSNAIKYSRPDIEPEITISTQLKNGHVQLSVRDNGIGIDMDKYGDKVFQLNQIFHQGYDSKGVGLFMTKTQIESVGGTISVSSRPNEGCEFTVTF